MLLWVPQWVKQKRKRCRNSNFGTHTCTQCPFLGRFGSQEAAVWMSSLARGVRGQIQPTWYLRESYDAAKTRGQADYTDILDITAVPDTWLSKAAVERESTGRSDDDSKRIIKRECKKKKQGRGRRLSGEHGRHVKDRKSEKKRLKQEEKCEERRFRGREGQLKEQKKERNWRWRQKMRLKPKGHLLLQIAKDPLPHWNIDWCKTDCSPHLHTQHCMHEQYRLILSL